MAGNSAGIHVLLIHLKMIANWATYFDNKVSSKLLWKPNNNLKFQNYTVYYTVEMEGDGWVMG